MLALFLGLHPLGPQFSVFLLWLFKPKRWGPYTERGRSEKLDSSQQNPDSSQRRSGTKPYTVTSCQARKFPKVYSNLFSKGLYLLFDLQGPAAGRASRLTTARPGQLCHGPLLLPSAHPAFSSRLLARLSVYMFPNSRRKSEYQTDLRSFDVAKGCYQVWGGCCAFEACLSFPGPYVQACNQPFESSKPP